MSDARRRGWVVVLAVALVVRLVAHGQMRDDPDTFAPIIDSEAYLLQALRVAAGAPLVEGATFQAPLYPWLLGWTLRLSGVPGAVGVASVADLPPELVQRALDVGRALNLGLGLLAVLLVWRTGLVLFGAGAALWAGLLAALYSPFLFYEGLLLKGTLSLLFLPWAVLAGVAAVRRGTAWPWAWCGLALGLGGLVRGNLHLLSWGGALLLVLHFARRRRLAHGAACAGALLLGAWAAVAPMIVRNSQAEGRLVLTTAAGGTAFYLCNHPDNDTGIVQHRSWNRQVPRYEEQDWLVEAERRTGHPMTPGEVNRFWFRQALLGIAERPGTWLLAEARKLGLLASRYEAPDNTMPSFAEATVPVLAWTPSRYAIALPLAIGGLVLAWRWRRREPAAPGRAVLAIALAAYACSLLPFNVTSRFRLPLAPLVLVYAGTLLSRLRQVVAQAADRRAVAGAVLFGLGLSLVNEWPLGPLSRKERAGHEIVCLLNRAGVALGRGETGRARADLDRALALAADTDQASAALHVEAAQLAWQEGDTEASQRHVERVLRLDPDHPAAWALLGRIAYGLGNDADAIEAFERSLQAQPRDRTVTQYLVLALINAGRLADAEAHAAALAQHDPSAEDGWGLLALARARAGRTAEAQESLRRYDELVARRRAGGLPPRFPDRPEFRMLRAP